MRTVAVPYTHRHLAPGGRRTARLVGSSLLMLHGAVHVAGFVVLLEGSAPGTLELRDAWPTPGTPLAVVVGLLWLVAAAAFILGGYRCRAHLRWRPVIAVAAALSFVLSFAMVLAAPAGPAVIGLVVDLVLIAWLSEDYLTKPRPIW